MVQKPISFDECRITILDEVNCVFSGVRKQDVSRVIEKTGLMVAGARQSASYKIGAWDGKESQFKKDGSTFIFMIPKVVEILETLGYSFTLEDHRKEDIFTPNHIDEGFLIDYGIILRDYQYESVNLAIDHRKGCFQVATAGGKTNITAAIAKVYEPAYRTIVIVPNENLVEATYKKFEDVGLDVGKIHGKIPKQKRSDQWNKRHVVTTWQTLNNERTYLHNFDVVCYDEAHIMGDVMFSILSEDLKHAPIRIGLTGTFPEDKQKNEKIFCHIGNDIIYTVDPKQLMDEGHISTVDITLIPVEHSIDLPTIDTPEIDAEIAWQKEEDYLLTNIKRRRAIADYIRSLHPKPTLILCFSSFGIELAKDLNLDFINKDVSPAIRQTYFDKFSSSDSYTLVATYDTVGTGISIDQIKRIVLIDVGKNKVRIIQGIGRGLRKDGIDNHLHVLDIYARLYKGSKISRNLYSFSATKHLVERKKIYNKFEYPYKDGNVIHVVD